MNDAPLHAWIDAQADAMRQLVIEWANINTGTLNLTGMEQFAAVLQEAFSGLGCDATLAETEPAEFVDERGEVKLVPVGRALLLRRRPEAKQRVLLVAHLDTVYSADHPFQRCEQAEENVLRGPGVADIKGGICVMLKALEAFERSAVREQLGWEVLLTPDEEIGSPGSRQLLASRARACNVGLVFEPALADGAMVRQRKGSGNFTLVVRGRAAHAGRHFDLGRNAVAALARAVVEIDALSGQRDGLTVNIAKLEGGGAANVVPDLAIARFNVRISRPEDEPFVCDALERIAQSVVERDGLSARLHGTFLSPPKVVDAATESLMRRIESCAAALRIPIHWRDTGGVCDGNKLAAAGLPNIDTMGVRGGDLHQASEFLLLDSLTERAGLVTQLLLEFARSAAPAKHGHPRGTDDANEPTSPG